MYHIMYSSYMLLFILHGDSYKVVIVFMQFVLYNNNHFPSYIGLTTDVIYCLI
jgi:hypothetical protein